MPASSDNKEGQKQRKVYYPSSNTEWPQTLHASWSERTVQQYVYTEDPRRRGHSSKRNEDIVSAENIALEKGEPDSQRAKKGNLPEKMCEAERIEEKG